MHKDRISKLYSSQITETIVMIEENSKLAKVDQKTTGELRKGVSLKMEINGNTVCGVHSHYLFVSLPCDGFAPQPGGKPSPCAPSPLKLAPGCP